MLVVPTGGEIGMPAIEPPRVPWASPHRDTVHSRRGIKATVTGRFVDLSAHGKSLKPGGLYRARAGERTIVFKVDAYARPGKGPIVGRLINL